MLSSLSILSKCFKTSEDKDQKPPQQFDVMFTYSRWFGSSADGSGADCKLGLTMVKPRTAGRISCRHSTPTSFLVLLRLWLRVNIEMLQTYFILHTTAFGPLHVYYDCTARVEEGGVLMYCAK